MSFELLLAVSLFYIAQEAFDDPSHSQSFIVALSVVSHVSTMVATVLFGLPQQTNSWSTGFRRYKMPRHDWCLPPVVASFLLPRLQFGRLAWSSSFFSILGAVPKVA